MSQAQAAVLAGGATLGHLRELVESSIESDDVAPLVKAVFEVQPAGEPLPLPLTRDSESATTSQGELGQLPQGSVLDAVLEMLQDVAEQKESEIQQICRANAPEIAGAMHELGAMQRQTVGLRQQLLANNATLQGVGTAFAGRLEEVQEVVALQQGVAEARKAVSSVLQVLLLCARAAKLIEGKQLYKAYKTLEAIQRNHGAVLQVSGSSGSDAYRDTRPLLPSNSREGTPHKPAAAAAAAGLGQLGIGSCSGGGGGGGGAVQLGPLAGFLRERVAELAAALEQRALADFHGWLANVRAQARTIGMHAIRWAASERQQEEALTRQRKLLLPRLEGQGDVRQAGALVAQCLSGPGLRELTPPTPLQLPAGSTGTPYPVAAPAASGGSHSASSTAPAASSGSTSSSATAARFAAFKAARQAASSPTRAGPGAGEAAGAGAGVELSPPGTAGSRAAVAGSTPSPLQQQQQQARAMQRSDTMPATGDLLAGVDMAPLHRCVHIHSCLGRLHQFSDYYAQNRRQQLAADLALQGGGDFLEHYQSYLTQLAGYFLVEDAVQQQAVGAAGEPLDIVGQVDAAWDAAVAALKGVLEPAFRGATAAAAMLTVKDFILLLCLALDHCGYHTVAIREMLMNSRAKYHELLGAATAVAVQAAIAGDSLAPVEVKSEGRADELSRQLALPATFHTEDAGNKRPPFKAPFSSMAPDLVRIIRGHVVDSVAYLKGLLTAGEVLPAARQHRDRMLARIVVVALQQRVDAAAGDPALPLTTALQLVANVAAVMQALLPLDDFALAQARGETAETTAAAAAAAEQRSRSSSPARRGRSRSRSVSPAKAAGVGSQAPAVEQRGRQQQGGTAVGAEGGDRDASLGRASSHGSAPSPSGGPPSPQQQQQAPQPQGMGSQQSGHTVLSFPGASGAAPAAGSAGPAAAAAPGGSAAAFQALLGSAEALVVQAVAAKARGLLAEGEQLDWVPDEQQRSTAYSPHIEELILHLKECASLLNRMAPAPSVERMLRGVLRYLADALMLQLMSDAVPAFNIFGLQRLFSDVGGLSRVAASLGAPGLGEELSEPLLFCEMMVFGSLEELLQPEQRASKYGALNLQRCLLVLDKYRELDKASGFAGMHKSKQAERFISRKTVDKVVKELRGELSRPNSRASSSAGSFTGARSAGGSFTTARNG